MSETAKGTTRALPLIPTLHKSLRNYLLPCQMGPFENVESKPGKKSHEWPTVSFVIPTMNSSETLGACLESIRRQDYPEIEIIIVDGGSTDATVEIAEKFKSRVLEVRGKLGAARQIGLEHANGETIAMFDSDIIIPHTAWLRNAVECFEISPSVSTVWPVNEAPPDAGPVCRLYFEIWRETFRTRFRRGRGVFGGGNSLFKRDIVLKCGGLSSDIHWGEDLDLAQKLKRAGYQVVLLFDPLYHDTMRSARSFIRKQFVGAETFGVAGFGIMGLDATDVVVEHLEMLIVGLPKGVLRGRSEWLLYPGLFAARIVAYAHRILRSKLRGTYGFLQEVDTH